jgi:hypothetical protein
VLTATVPTTFVGDANAEDAIAELNLSERKKERRGLSLRRVSDLGADGFRVVPRPQQSTRDKQNRSIE